MIKLDLHIHSSYSEDAIGKPKDIIKVLKKKGLKGMAITDHNNIEGGLNALKFASKEFVVIPGIEISTMDGHILALNVIENITKKLSIEETIEKIIDIGGTPVIPHLFRNMSGIKLKKLKEIQNNISAIEVFNSCSMFKTNLKAAKTANRLELGGTGGSDSHDIFFVGSGYTKIENSDLTIDGIITEIEKKHTWGEGTPMPWKYRLNRMLKSVNQFFNRGFKRI